MRRFMLACLVVILVAAVIQSIKTPILVSLVGPRSGLLIASIGDIFRHF